MQQNWAKLLEVRSQVLSQLEICRINKNIGKSLEAVANIEASPLAYRLLKKYEQSLAELLNVSEAPISMRGMEGFAEARMMNDSQFSEYISDKNLEADFAVGTSVLPSTEPKCERCWRHVPDVGKQEKYPTVCHRCAEALDAIDFPAYAATSNKE
jgi:isoleucyl-tRNA synthetase